MRSILVVVGRTRKAEECLEVAARIALETGSVLHAVHPVGPGGIPGGEDGDHGVLEARIRRRIPPGVAVGSVRVAARATHEAVAGALRESAADLVVASPAGTTAVWMDPALAQVALRTAPAVLIVREQPRWPPRRVLVPLLPGAEIGGTLRRVGAWARSLWPAAADGAPPQEIRVLFAPADVDELHGTSARVERGIGRLRDEVPQGASVRLLTSIRWGAKPLQRIVRSTEFGQAELLVLDRAEAEAATDAAGRHPWFHLLASSSCPALLLPAGGREIHPGAAARPTPRAEAASPAPGRAELPGKTVPMVAAP